MLDKPSVEIAIPFSSLGLTERENNLVTADFALRKLNRYMDELIKNQKERQVKTVTSLQKLKIQKIREGNQAYQSKVKQHTFESYPPR